MYVTPLTTPQAHFSHKPGKAEWADDKDHRTETCDTDLPSAEHLVDGDYTPHHPPGQNQVLDQTSRSVRLGPPMRAHPGFNKEDFQSNWEERTLTCPNGAVSPP